jgi:hypothetical protein
MSFRDTIQAEVAAGLRGISHAVQGLIPADGIDFKNWTCTVRIPNPHGGVHPGRDQTGQPNSILLKDVALPPSPGGLISAALQKVSGHDRACIVGFRGGKLSFPYIVSMLNLVHAATDRENAEKVPNRGSQIASALLTAPPPTLDPQMIIPNILAQLATFGIGKLFDAATTPQDSAPAQKSQDAAQAQRDKTQPLIKNILGR